MNVLHYFHNTYTIFLTDETNEASAGGGIETTAEASPGEGELGAGMTDVAEM